MIYLMTNCNKTEKNINFPMPAVHFLTDSAHQRHLLAASNVLQAHLQAMVLLQYFMVAPLTAQLVQLER